VLDEEMEKTEAFFQYYVTRYRDISSKYEAARKYYNERVKGFNDMLSRRVNLLCTADSTTNVLRDNPEMCKYFVVNTKKLAEQVNGGMVQTLTLLYFELSSIIQQLEEEMTKKL